jgi:hypothetical protein
VQAAKQFFLRVDLTEEGAVVPNMTKIEVSKEESKVSGGAVVVHMYRVMSSVGLIAHSSSFLKYGSPFHTPGH